MAGCSNRSALGTVLLILSLFGFVTDSMAQVRYHVQVDTSPLIGQSGFVDLQFNPGGLDSLSATVTIANFFTDGILSVNSDNMGGAIGTLPNVPDVYIANSDGFNDLFQDITFGNKITFDAVFVGEALSPNPPIPTFGSAFAFSLYDSVGTLPLLTTAEDGSMLHIEINADGTTSAIPFPDSDGVFRAGAILQVAAPEPGTIALVLPVLIGGLFMRRRGFVACRKASRQ